MNIIPIPESMTKKSGRIKMKKRVLVALLATALTVSMMTGCGSKKTEDTSSTKTEETSEDSDQYQRHCDQGHKCAVGPASYNIAALGKILNGNITGNRGFL